jgi:hypothetical protein
MVSALVRGVWGSANSLARLFKKFSFYLRWFTIKGCLMEHNLYICIENGLPVNHPAFTENLIEAFGKVPDNWEPFIRILNPTLLDKRIVLTQPEPSYEKIDGVWQDVWHTRLKTAEEIAAEKEQKLNSVRQLWAKNPYAHNFTAWILNEEKFAYEPPLPRPTDGKFYRWHGPSNNWREAEPFPQDGKRYTFDFDNWVNVEVPNVPIQQPGD